MLHPKILIIGAGAAGIAAASKLIANNIYNVTILEAEDRFGGRIFTSQLGYGTVELGAQWVHGAVGNVVHSLGSEALLLDDNSYDITKSACVFSDGTLLDDETGSKLYDLFNEIMDDDSLVSKFKGSLGDFVHESLKEKIKNKELEVNSSTLNSFVDWFHKFQNSLDGSDSWFLTSAPGTLEYHWCEGNSLTRWKSGGYSNIFNLLMGNNAAKIKEKLLLNKSVQKIAWDKKPVEVLCTDGERFTADYVLLTVSLGVLKDRISSLFKPSLPHKKLQAIQGLGIGTVDKIFLKFPHRWWPADCNGFCFLWKANDKPSEGGTSWVNEIFGFYSVDSNPLVMCGWVVGEPARSMEQASDEQVMQSCHELLVKFLGGRYNIPPPDSVLRSQWHTNPNFRGSYSFRSLTSEKLGVTAADLAAPLCDASGQPVVLFGGEATHDHYYSTVHGAVETGWREADRIISLLKQPSLKLPKSSL